MSFALTTMSSAKCSTLSSSVLSSEHSWKLTPRVVAWVLRPFSDDGTTTTTTTSHVWWPSLLYPSWKDAAKDAVLFYPKATTHIRIHTCANSVSLEEMSRNRVPGKVALRLKKDKRLAVCYYLGNFNKTEMAEWSVTDIVKDVKNYRAYYNDAVKHYNAVSSSVPSLLKNHLLARAIEEVYVFLGANDEQLLRGVKLLHKLDEPKSKKRSKDDGKDTVSKKRATARKEDEDNMTPQWYHEWDTQCTASQTHILKDPSQFTQLPSFSPKLIKEREAQTNSEENISSSPRALATDGVNIVGSPTRNDLVQITTDQEDILDNTTTGEVNELEKDTLIVTSPVGQEISRKDIDSEARPNSANVDLSFFENRTSLEYAGEEVQQNATAGCTSILIGQETVSDVGQDLATDNGTSTVSSHDEHFTNIENTIEGSNVSPDSTIHVSLQNHDSNDKESSQLTLEGNQNKFSNSDSLESSTSNVLDGKEEHPTPKFKNHLRAVTPHQLPSEDNPLTCSQRVTPVGERSIDIFSSPNTCKSPDTNTNNTLAVSEQKVNLLDGRVSWASANEIVWIPPNNELTMVPGQKLDDKESFVQTITEHQNSNCDNLTSQTLCGQDAASKNTAVDSVSSPEVKMCFPPVDQALFTEDSVNKLSESNVDGDIDSDNLEISSWSMDGVDEHPTPKCKNLSRAVTPHHQLLSENNSMASPAGALPFEDFTCPEIADHIDEKNNDFSDFFFTQ